MKAFARNPEEITDSTALGRVLCHDVTSVGEMGRVRLGKGHLITEVDIPALQSYSGEIHLIEMDEGDVHEDEASIRIGRAVAGDGIQLRGPVESQTQLRATYPGLLKVRADMLLHLNGVSDVSVFTAFDGQPVTTGKLVGATKVTPLVVPGSIVSEVETICEQHGPAVCVHPFLGRPVGVVARDRVAGKARDKFENAIHMKIGWFGSTVAGIRYVGEDVETIAAAVQGFVSENVCLVLAAGVNSTDPLDPTIQALDLLGAETERRGVPAHPGSTCWLAYLERVPIFGLALCGMFSRTTVLDLLLPRFLSGQPVRADLLSTLGHGGLLGRDMTFRFPSYSAEPAS